MGEPLGEGPQTGRRLVNLRQSILGCKEVGGPHNKAPWAGRRWADGRVKHIDLGGGG